MLPPMAPDMEREVRNGAKQVIAGHCGVREL
jgi:hypothetical protein